MSRTFHRSSELEKNRELIERRKIRSGRHREETGIFGEHIGLSYVQELTRKALTRIIQESKNGQGFIGKINEWDDQYILSQYDGTFSEKYSELNKEMGGHLIYSPYTERKVATLLQYNPECTDIYLGKDESPYPLLTHQVIQPVMLSEKQVSRLMTQLWGVIISLIPPREFVETADYVREYCERIARDIEQTKIHINVALARPFDENPD